MPEKYVIVPSSSVEIPPCVSGTVTLQAFSAGYNYQCCIPQSSPGNYNTTATTNNPGLSTVGGGSYASSVVAVTPGERLTINLSSDASVTRTATGSVLVRARWGAYRNCYPACQIGQVIYPGGRHGKRYYKSSRSYCCCCNTVTVNGYVWGGWGGQAGPYGPGGCASSAYVVGCYRTSTTYLPGAGGAANGGTSAQGNTPGQSRWGPTGPGGGGAPGAAPGSREAVAKCGVGPKGGGGGNTTDAFGNQSTFYSSDQLIIISGCRTLTTGTIQRHFFTNNNTMTIPQGTYKIIVGAVGAGSAGSQNTPTYSTTTRARPGGGGGGHAASVNFTYFSSSGTMIVNVGATSCSLVYICGTTEVIARAATCARGGGVLLSNYARNGVTSLGGCGGGGYTSGTTRLAGGGGGGAAWSSFNFGLSSFSAYSGGNGGSAPSTLRGGPGGGGAASSVASGSAGAASAGTCRGAGGQQGGYIYGVCYSGSTGGYGGNGSTTNTFNCGQSGGTSTTVYYPIADSTYLNGTLTSPLSLGPGGGGGAGYGSATIRNDGGNGGCYGGGGGGTGNSIPGIGRGGLVVVTMYISGSPRSNITTGTSHVQFID